MAKSLILLSVWTCFRVVFTLQYQQQPYGLYDQQSVQHNPFTFRNYQGNTFNQEPVNVQQPVSTQQSVNDYQRQIQQWQIAVLGSQSGDALKPKPTPSGPGGNIWLQIPGYYDTAKNEPAANPPAPTIVAPLPPGPPPSYPQQPQVGPAPPQPPPPGLAPSYPQQPPVSPAPQPPLPPGLAPSYPQQPPVSPAPQPPLPPGSVPSYPQQPQVSPAPFPIPEAPVPEVPNNELYPAPQPPQQPPQPENPLKKYCKSARGQFPSQSCRKFVNCWDDTIVEQDCPSGLYFNELGFCDYPINVPCQDSGDVGISGIGGVGGAGGAGGAGGVGGAGGPGGVGGIGGVGGGSGQPGVGVTGGGSEVTGGEGGSGGSGGTGGYGELGTKCPQAYGTYRSKLNCGVFYVCAGGIPYEFTCPAGLNFHEDLKVCDYPYRVECNGVPTNVAPPETSTDPEVGTTALSESASPGQTFPPQDQGFLPSVSPTPENTIPSAPVQGQSYSGPQTAFYSLRKIPAGLLDSTKPCAYNTVFRLNPSCTSVAVCQNGLTRVIKCGPGTGYDSFSGQCVPSFRASC